MDVLDLDSLQEAPERWVNLGNVGFHVRYASPSYGDTFRRLCAREGIGKTVDGRFEVNLGRESDYYGMIAKHYILGWRGITKGGQEASYDPDQMKRVLATRGDILKAIVEAIGQDESFFAPNGNKPT